MTRHSASVRRVPRRVAAGLIGLMILIVGFGVAAFGYGLHPDVQPASAQSASAEPAPVTVTPPPPSEAEQRAAFLAIGAAERGITQFPDGTAQVTEAQAVCATITADPTSAGVWASAAALEDGPYLLPDDAAWAYVDLSVAVYCPSQANLVTLTVARALGG